MYFYYNFEFLQFKPLIFFLILLSDAFDMYSPRIITGMVGGVQQMFKPRSQIRSRWRSHRFSALPRVGRGTLSLVSWQFNPLTWELNMLRLQFNPSKILEFYWICVKSSNNYILLLSLLILCYLTCYSADFLKM